MAPWMVRLEAPAGEAGDFQVMGGTGIYLCPSLPFSLSVPSKGLPWGGRLEVGLRLGSERSLGFCSGSYFPEQCVKVPHTQTPVGRGRPAR